MKNITLFNQVNLLQSFCKRMATATTSCAHSYKRYYLLLTILLFVGVNNAWGAPSARYFLIGDPTGGSWDKDNNYKIQTRYEKDGQYILYVYASKDCFFRLKKDDNADYGPSSDQSTSQGYGGYNTNAWKYNGNSGIVRFGVDETAGNNGEHYPYVFWEKVDIKIKHGWNGGDWTVQDMVAQSDGTYTYTGLYSGNNQTNFGIEGSDATFKFITNAKLVGSPSKGNKCLFTYNSVGYKGYGTETENTGSATITRLYTITYNGNGHTGGTVPEAVDKKHGTNITLSNSTPTRTGYTFARWNTEKDGTGTSYDEGATYSTDADVTLYAKWTAHKYRVIFNANGGEGSMKDQSFTYDVEQALTKNEFTRVGYTFAGWNENASGNSTSYTDQQPVKNLNATSGGQKTLYAQWKPNTYTVQFDGNGSTSGSMKDQSFTYDKSQNLTANAFLKTDHTFAGWAISESGDVEYGDEEDVKNLTTQNGATIMLYAQWFELVVTQLQWSEDSYTATMEADNDFPDLTILPNDFAGVLTYQSSNPAVATIAADGTITLIGTGTTTITASIAADDTYLAASDSYELTVAASNCRWVEVTDNTTLEDGDKVVITMTKGNYVWTISNAKNTSTAPTANDITANIQGNYLTTVSDAYKWVIEKNNANLTFYSCSDNPNYLYCTNADNGVRVGTGDAKVFVVDGNYLKNTQTNSPRYIGVSLNTTPYSWRCYTDTTGVIKDQTLKFYKGECLDSEHYWLIWDATDGQFADGSKQIVKDYAIGTTINKPFDPTRTGYDFAGWSTDGVNVVTPAENMPNKNLSYSAVWQIKSYTVTWDANGGQFANSETIIEQTYEYGATITKPADPTRTGYTFTGWAPNVPTNMSTENLNFKAQWQVNQYTVTWDPDGGHWDGDHNKKEEAYNYGAQIVKPAAPEKTGRVFLGWQPEVEEIMPNSHLTYTAQWGEAFCNEYSFHWGNGSDEQVKVDNYQACFVQKDNTHEWQVTHFTVPAETKYFVGYKGWWYYVDLGLGDDNGQRSKSVMKEWTGTGDQVMYLAHIGRGCTLGHAVGAKGTLRIYDNTSLDNLDVAFIPDGYKLKFGVNEYDFEHYEDAEYRSEIVEYNATTANNNVSVGVINTSNAYVKTDHTQEGMRHVFLKVNSNWKSEGAKFAIYYWDNNGDGWSAFMKTVPGETDMYEGWIPDNYTNFKFVRLKNDAGTPNWENKWNETGNLTLHNGKTLYTIPSSSWDGADDNNWSTYQRKGKFRIYNNSWDKNWYVNFYPHYVITFDKNAADATGTMQPQALPLDANPMTMVLNECAFERRGYDFTGWKTDVAITADGNSVAANGNVKDKATISNINKDITLKAQWKAQAYTITYKDQGDVAYSGENEASLPQTHTYDQMTTLVAGVKTGYTFGGWYTTPECVGTAVTELGAQDYIADITLYAKWTFAMEYNLTNTETIFITSAKGQKIKATTPIVLSVNNMPVGTKVAISAPNITFYDEVGNVVTDLTTNFISESFSLSAAYTPTEANITEQPTITLSVLGNEKTIEGLISARSLPETFAIVAKVGNIWYALPSQGLNSTTPPAAYPIEVDNMADPTAVTEVPANADWSLRQVYEAIRDDATKDRFVANGENFVFVNNEGTPKALNASASGNYLLTDAQYSGYYETNPGLYEWTPTTSDLETYTLTNAERTDRTLNVSINTVFGVHYDNKATTEVRFLPIENRYTPLALQVVEWKEKSVVVMYNGDPAQTASVSVNAGEAQTTTLSSAQKDIAVYELTADGLATNPTQSLSITIGSEKVILPIPYIVSGDLDDATLLGGDELTIARRQEVAKVSDLVILKGATLTAAGAKGNPYKFRNVTIYGGGSLIIPADKGFEANTLTMRVGGVENREYVYTYPQLDLNGTINSGNINLDLMTTYDYYYPFSVPYEVSLKDIHYPVEIYGSNVKPTNKGSFLVSYYDGEERAKGNSGWKDVEEQGKEVLSPHVGYSIWGLPKKVSVNGATSDRQTYGIHRIPMKKSADEVMKNEIQDCTVSISAYNATRDNDKGWNFIGNPYLVQHGGLDGSDTDVYMGLLVKEMKDGQWTGGWVFNGEQVRYVTQTNDCLNYTSTPVANATIPAFSAFFIQAARDGAIAFTSPNVAAAQSLAARRSDENKEITTGIILSGEKHSDRTGLLVADEFTEAYEFNADLSKFDNQDMNLYTISSSGKLAFMAINEELAKQTIPLGYSVSADGMYTIAFDEQRYNRNDIYALYLIDYDRNETTNLLQTDYNFYSEFGAHVERFALQVAFVQKTPTDVEYTQVGNVLVSREGNTLRLDNLPSNATVTIYDAVGHLIEQHSPSQHLQVNLPTGYYLMHIANKQDAVVIDTFIP